MKIGNDTVNAIYIGSNPVSKVYTNNTEIYTTLDVPDAITDLNTVSGNEYVYLSWTAPNSNGSPITDYTIESSTDNSNWTLVDDGISTDNFYTVTSLTNETTYYFRVYSINSIGTSLVSNIPSGLPNLYPPDAPGVNVDSVGDGSVTISWNEPEGYGLVIDSYEVESSTDNSTWSVVASEYSGGLTYTFSELTNGTTYYFRVAANSVGGTSSYDSVSAVPGTVPSVPTNFTITSGDEELSLAWGAPDNDGGYAVTGYLIEISTDNSNYTTLESNYNTTSYTATSLYNETVYYLRVSAINLIGTGPSVEDSKTPNITLPSAPNNLSINMTADNEYADAELTWDPPTEAGSRGIYDYKIQISLDEGNNIDDTVSDPASPYVWQNLTQGVYYWFRVAGTTDSGNLEGTYTGWTISSYALVPEAITDLTALAGDNEVTLSWTEPNDRGAPITDYVIEHSTDLIVWTTVTDGTNTNTSYTVTGLTNNTTYTFRVASVNSAGTSDYSNTDDATPNPIPADAPANFSVSMSSDGGGYGGANAELTWDAPAEEGSRGPIYDYIMQISTNGGVTVDSTLYDDGSPYTWTGLLESTTYWFRIAARTDTNGALEGNYTGWFETSYTP